MLLKDILQLKYGRNQAEVADSNGKYPIYGTGGVMGYANDFLYNKPSILFGRKGSISKVQFVDKPFWCVDTTFYSIIDESKVIPKYLFYKFENIDFSVFDEGTTIPSLRTETLNKLNFSIDSMETQQHIVDTIGSVDDLIEKNNEIILKTHNLINNLYLKETNNLELVKISNLNYFKICKSGIGEFENNKIYLDTAAVSDINIIDESYIIDYEGRPSRANMQPKENTIWFAKLKDSPKYILIKNQKNLIDNFIFSTGFMGLESENFIVNYLYVLILSKSFTNQKNLVSNGATMQGINNEIFNNILVPNVSYDEAKEIGKKLEIYVDLICELQNKNNKLKNLKHLLLQKYFG